MSEIRGTFKHIIMKFQNLRTKNFFSMFPERRGKKRSGIRIYNQEPWEAEDNGENVFQTRVSYPDKISIKGEDRK